MTGFTDHFAEAWAEAGFEFLPSPMPMGNYVPFVISGGHVHLAGVTPRGPSGGHPWKGEVGVDLGLEEARRAARLAALNLIGNLQVACAGDLERVEQFVMLRGYAIARPTFGDVPQVIDGASELINEIFGEAGRHARTSLGVAALPGNVAVELDAIVRIRS